MTVLMVAFQVIFWRESLKKAAPHAILNWMVGAFAIGGGNGFVLRRGGQVAKGA